MEVENGLTNVKGYRAKYINALNKAVTQNQIVGGDVTPTVTMGGTLLHLKREATPKRFQLHRATYQGKSVLAVSNGSFFNSGEIVKFANCNNVHYVSSGLLPRGKGWYFDGVTVNDSVDVEVSIIKARNQYWMAFIAPAYSRPEDLLPNQTASEEFERIVTIGLFNYSGDVQYVNTDIYYGGGVAESESVKDWTVRNNGGVWQVFNPRIYAVSPTPPEEGLENLWNAPTMNSFILGTSWNDLSQYVDIDVGFLNIEYNPWGDGAITFSISTTMQATTTRKWCLGQFTQGESGLTFTQFLDGEMVLDASSQTPSFNEISGSGYSADFEEPTSGSTIFVGVSFWSETLYVEGVPMASAIVKDQNNQSVKASTGVKFRVVEGVYMSNDMTMSSTGALLPLDANYNLLGDVTRQATKTYTGLTTKVGSTSPTSTTEQGEIYAESTSAYILVSGTIPTPSKTTLLYTEVEEANDSSTYSATTED